MPIVFAAPIIPPNDTFNGTNTILPANLEQGVAVSFEGTDTILPANLEQ